MAQLKITTDDFGLSSEWMVTAGSDGTLHISDGPHEASRTITFNYEIPDNTTIISSKVHSVWGSKTGPIGGYASGYPKVNDIRPRADDDWMIDISIDPDATSVNVTFKLKVGGSTSSQGEKSSYVDITDVYLLIEYEFNYSKPNLVEYTDADPVQGETYVKAVHMTELHTNVNLIRVARKLADYAFASIVAMETGLGGWNDHVLDIRSAIDEMNIAHEDWIELGENYPRLDVLLQLRRVVQAVSEP